MGFGNYVPFERKAPPDPTFGELRQELLGYTIKCLKCRHARFITPKQSRYLRARLPDDMRLREAKGMFRCSECNHNRVRLIAELVWEQIERLNRERRPDD